VRVAHLLCAAFACCVACSFEPGALHDDARTHDAGGDARDGSVGSEPAPQGVMFVGSQQGSSSGMSVVSVSSSATGGATYVLAVATTSYVGVAGVVGLGASWSEVGDQCGARSRTGVSVWVARGPIFSGNVTATLTGVAQHAVAVLAVYVNSSSTGASKTYNALDATTCTATDSSVDLDAYSFSIAGTSGGRVVAAVATRGHAHTPATGLTQRRTVSVGDIDEGEAAGVVVVDGDVSAISGSFDEDVDVAAVAIELR
jgi:hypothetical protein